MRSACFEIDNTAHFKRGDAVAKDVLIKKYVAADQADQTRPFSTNTAGILIPDIGTQLIELQVTLSTCALECNCTSMAATLIQ